MTARAHPPRPPDPPDLPDLPDLPDPPDYAAVILAGGASRRLGGADKAAVRVGGRTLLDRVLAACPDAAATVVVGPRRPTARPVRWVREDPPGGGPLPALAAGLAAVDRPVTVVLATDLPFLDRALVRTLAAPPADADGLIVADAEGRDQPLTGGYRTAALRRALSGLAAAPDDGETAPAGPYGLRGMPLRRLLPALTLRRINTNGPLDCDTWADIAAARARIREHGHVLEEWLAAVKAELNIDPEVDIHALLDAARDAAHGVTRPAAPLTTFLLGYAAARHGTDQAEAARAITALADRWQREMPPERDGQPENAS
jgi:molybdopterin-guanine dinucleotide biosynthesis protein A